MLKPRFAGTMSPLGANPAIAYRFGSCDMLAYTPCSTAERAGLNAAIPEAGVDDATGAGAVTGSAAGGAAADFVSAACSRCSSA